MLKIDDNLLQEIGLGSLPAEEKRGLLSHIYETLEMRVGMRLADQMTNEQLDEFEQYFEAKDDAGAFKWLESNFPNYKDIVNEEFEKLKTEVAGTANQILMASQQNMAAHPLQPQIPQQPQPMAQAAYDVPQPAAYQPAPQPQAQPYQPAPQQWQQPAAQPLVDPSFQTPAPQPMQSQPQQQPQYMQQPPQMAQPYATPQPQPFQPSPQQPYGSPQPQPQSQSPQPPFPPQQPPAGPTSPAA